VGNSPRGASYRRRVLGRIARPLIPACAALAAAAWVPAASAQGAPAGQFDFAGWDSYLGGSDSSQFSSLTQINKDNVNQLEVAWTYETGEKGEYQANNLIVDGVLYTPSASRKVIALDAATGRELWKWDPATERSGKGAPRHQAGGQGSQQHAAIQLCHLGELMLNP